MILRTKLTIERRLTKKCTLTNTCFKKNLSNLNIGKN